VGTPGATVNAAIFAGCIQARPGATDACGLRQLDEALGVRVSQECISKVKQGIAGTREAGLVQAVTELRQGGRIHRRTSLH
jgi:hypothetical protein